MTGKRVFCGGGDGGGGGGGGRGLEAGQHQVLSGETIVGGSSFRVWAKYADPELLFVVAEAEEEMVVSRDLRRLGLMG